MLVGRASLTSQAVVAHGEHAQARPRAAVAGQRVDAIGVQMQLLEGGEFTRVVRQRAVQVVLRYV